MKQLQCINTIRSFNLLLKQMVHYPWHVFLALKKLNIKAKLSGKAIQLNCNTSGNTLFGQKHRSRAHRIKTCSPGNYQNEIQISTMDVWSLSGNAKHKKIAYVTVGNATIRNWFLLCEVALHFMLKTQC